MLLLLINVSIVIFGLGAFFLAFGGNALGESPLEFGGDKWSNDDSPFYKRITPRGWVSLICLLIMLGLVLRKDTIQQHTVLKERRSRVEFEEDNIRLQQRIADHVKNIIKLQKQTERATNDLSIFTRQIEEHQLASIEAAFKLSAKPSRESDDAVIQLDGQSSIPIPSQYQQLMQLYSGDRFYFTTFIQDFSGRDLSSIQLEVGGKVYSLFKADQSGFFEKTFHISGPTSKPMTAVILNPLLLTNMTLKIFIQPKIKYLGQDVFRQLILESPFSEFAKKIYKATTADILNIRSEPSSSATILSRLSRGSFVHTIREQDGWVEVLTPRGIQGWIMSRFLSEIK